MKYIILSIFLTVFVHANELERMESIVADIENLRLEHDRCKKELDAVSVVENVLKTDAPIIALSAIEEQSKSIRKYKRLLDDEKKKNSSLLAEIETLTQVSREKDSEIENLNKTNKKENKILETKENIKNDTNEKLLEELETKYREIIKGKENLILSLKNKLNIENKTKIVEKEICEDDNPFPTLIMKDSVEKAVEKNENITTAIVIKKQKVQEIIEIEKNTKATTFRLNKNSGVYDDINGNVVFIWDDKTSFTSIKMTQNWIEISGYFIDGKWTQADRNLWIEKINTIKR